MIRLFVFATLILPITGCTHLQLGRNSVGQAQSVMDIHQQQVLSNLAMFACEPNSLPSFALPKSGTNQLQDTAGLQTPLAWGRFTTNALFGFMTGNVNPNLQRVTQQSWGIDPVNDPRKLELMRCAYQTAVANCGIAEPAITCIDCRKKFNSFYSGDPKKPPTSKDGSVTSDCLATGQCWFRIGCRKCVPKDCENYCAEYRGQYVWVPPEGRDQLAKLTLAILDYAVNDAKKSSAPTKDVIFTVDATGMPTKKRAGVAEVKATISSDEQIEAVLTKPFVGELNVLMADNGVDSSKSRTDIILTASFPDDSADRLRSLFLKIQAGGDPDGLFRDTIDRILRRNGLAPSEVPNIEALDAFITTGRKFENDKKRAVNLWKKIDAIAKPFTTGDDGIDLERLDLKPNDTSRRTDDASPDYLNIQRQLNRVLLPQ